MARYKLYRYCYCTSRHRTYRAMARCVWSRADTVDGEGPYALLMRCRAVTVNLHASPEQAEEECEIQNVVGCCGRCSRSHEIIQLVLP